MKRRYGQTVDRILELSISECAGIVPIAGQLVRHNGISFRAVGVRRTEIGYHLQLVRLEA